MVSYIMSQITVGRDGDSLNPCCNGRWSRTVIVADDGFVASKS